MLSVLAVTFPFFALVFCGWAAAQRCLLPESAIPGLNGFVLFFALPCMLFRFGRDTPLPQLADPRLLAVYAGVAVLIVGLTVSLTRRIGMKDAAFGALVAAFPNSGFMGVPLLIALLGSGAAGPVISTLLVDLFLTSSLCLALTQAGHGVRAFGQALRAVAGNPQPWAIAAGAGLGWLGWSLPGPLDKAIGMLGQAASPVALFTIGAVISASGRHAAGPTPLRRFLPVALIKLLLHPVLIFAGGSVAGLAREPLVALTLTAALPSASNVSLLAERHGADNGRIARIILASTALAFLSFSAWANYLMGTV
jgi:hypothetical protein